MNEEETEIPEQDDVRLMAATAAGDESAFTELINRYQKTIYNYFFRMGCDAQRAEDYSQETFLRLYQHAGSYTPQAKLVTWLLTIARNCLIDHARRRKLNEKSLGAWEAADDRAGPEQLAERREFQASVDAALAALPDIQREAVVLAVVQDMPYENVAEVLGVPLGTVKSRVYYGLKALREALNQQGYQSGD